MSQTISQYSGLFNEDRHARAQALDWLLKRRLHFEGLHVKLPRGFGGLPGSVTSKVFQVIHLQFHGLVAQRGDDSFKRLAHAEVFQMD